jgi:hypothetical protein
MKNIIILLVAVIIYTWVDDKGVIYLTNYTPHQGAEIVVISESASYSHSSPRMTFADLPSEDINITVNTPKPQVIIIKTIRKRGRKSFREYSRKRDHWNKKK